MLRYLYWEVGERRDVQIAAYQCLPGDSLNLNSSFAGKSATFEPTVCALWITGIDDVEPYTRVVDEVVFSTTQPEVARQQLSFAAVWWTEPALANLVIDADKGIVYGTMSITTLSWEHVRRVPQHQPELEPDGGDHRGDQPTRDACRDHLGAAARRHPDAQPEPRPHFARHDGVRELGQRVPRPVGRPL